LQNTLYRERCRIPSGRFAEWLTGPENNYVTEMCSGSEAGSYLRLTDFVYHSTLGSRVIKKKEEENPIHVSGFRAWGVGFWVYRV